MSSGFLSNSSFSVEATVIVITRDGEEVIIPAELVHEIPLFKEYRVNGTGTVPMRKYPKWMFDFLISWYYDPSSNSMSDESPTNDSISEFRESHPSSADPTNSFSTGRVSQYQQSSRIYYPSYSSQPSQPSYPDLLTLKRTSSVREAEDTIGLVDFAVSLRNDRFLSRVSKVNFYNLALYQLIEKRRADYRIYESILMNVPYYLFLTGSRRTSRSWNDGQRNINSSGTKVLQYPPSSTRYRVTTKRSMMR